MGGWPSLKASRWRGSVGVVRKQLGMRPSGLLGLCGCATLGSVAGEL